MRRHGDTLAVVCFPALVARLESDVCTVVNRAFARQLRLTESFQEALDDRA